MPCSNFESNVKCCQCSTDKIIVAKDDGAKSTYRFLNPRQSKVCKVRVDGCLIDDVAVRKCDFLILDCNSKTAYLIELKGSDLMGAIDQINKSLDRLVSQLSAFGVINARIVLTRDNVPRAISGPAMLKLQKRLKMLGGEL